MDFDLTDEQRLLAETLAKYFAAVYDFDKRRAYMRHAAGFDPANWAQLATLGVLALRFDPSNGGFGGTLIDQHVVMQAMGRALCVEPYLSCVALAGHLLQQCGNAAQRAALLAPLMAGTERVTLAHAERGGRFAWHYCTTHAARRGDDFVLSGQKILVLHANGADWVIVVARTSGAAHEPGGLSLFLLPTTTPGLNWTAYRTVDGQCAADLVLQNVVVPAAALLGPLDGAAAALDAALAESSLALCSEALGCMDALLEITLDYVKNRVQFGQPIGRFQVIQHRLADVFMAIEQARSLVLRTLLMDTANAGQWQRAVAGTKAFVSETALKVGHEAIQLHGGMGVTDELNVSHYHKRLLMIQTLFGDAAFQMERFVGVDAAA